MGDSIFEFGDKFGIESPLGDWLQTQDQIAITDARIGITRFRQAMFDENAKLPGSNENRVALNVAVSTTGSVQTVTIDYNGLSYSGKPIVETSSQPLSNTFIVEIDVVVPVPYQNYEVKFDISATGSNGDQVFKRLITNVNRAGSSDKAQLFKCLCKGILTAADVENILTSLRKGEVTGTKYLRDTTKNTRLELGEYALDGKGNRISVPITQYDEIQTKIFHLKMKEQLPDSDKTMGALANAFNKAFSQADMNTCLSRIHFIAQCYHETDRFRKIYESNPPSTLSGGEFYRGRGFIQISHDYNYKEFYSSINGRMPTEPELLEFVPTLSTSIITAISASAWYWNKEKINQHANVDDVVNVSAAINYPTAIDGSENEISGINGLAERKLFTNLTKAAFNYEECKE